MVKLLATIGFGTVVVFGLPYMYTVLNLFNTAINIFK